MTRMGLSDAWGRPIGKLRVIGAFEGGSFLLLLGVAMPLKYWSDLPLLVRVMGPIHGLLFTWLCIQVAQVVFSRGWAKANGAAVVGAALLPFGPFLIDRWLKRCQLDVE